MVGLSKEQHFFYLSKNYSRDFVNRDYINIDEKIVDSRILTQNFICDLKMCKGACCTMESDFGAPLKDLEIAEIEKNLQAVFRYLPERSIKEIKENNFWEENDGMIMTRSINHRDCVFVYYEDDIAKCGIEKAYINKESDFRKPISCFLFPIRVGNFGGEVLKYEEYSECKPALKLGEKKGITIVEFCKDALKTAFGKVWYNKLKSYLE